MTFWNAFENLCLRKGMKPNPVAKEIGISSASVTKWKNGAVPNGTILAQIAEYFGVTTDYLLGRSESPNRMPLNIESLPDDFVPIPVIGEVAAGYTALAETNIEGYELVSASTLNDGYDYVFLNVKGDSMTPLIMEGDMVLVRVQEFVESGDYAVVIVDEENGVVKRIEYDSKKIILYSENSANYPPRVFVGEEMQRVRIFGKAIEIKRRLI